MNQKWLATRSEGQCVICNPRAQIEPSLEKYGLKRESREKRPIRRVRERENAKKTTSSPPPPSGVGGRAESSYVCSVRNLALLCAKFAPTLSTLEFGNPTQSSKRKDYCHLKLQSHPVTPQPCVAW